MVTFGRVGAFFWACTSVAALAADPLTVTVTCSNQRAMSKLQVLVYDNMGTRINATTPTDVRGRFTIPDPEGYWPPFYVRLQLDWGGCGPYKIQMINEEEGEVRLNYYPTELPCSCANLGLELNHQNP